MDERAAKLAREVGLRVASPSDFVRPPAAVQLDLLQGTGADADDSDAPQDGAAAAPEELAEALRPPEAVAPEKSSTTDHADPTRDPAKGTPARANDAPPAPGDSALTAAEQASAEANEPRSAKPPKRKKSANPRRGIAAAEDSATYVAKGAAEGAEGESE